MLYKKLKFSFLLLFLAYGNIIYCLESVEEKDKAENTNIYDFTICTCPAGSEAILGRKAKDSEGKEICNCSYTK